VPPRLWRDRARDILDLAARIRESTAGLSFDEFASNGDVRDANIYRVALIGEAANAIPEEVRDRRPDIPWRRIRDMRNVLMHVYFGIIVETVWDTIRGRVPELEQQIREMLEADPDEPTGNRPAAG
jgi:uncharacterized protein with HEPN domain